MEIYLILGSIYVRRTEIINLSTIFIFKDIFIVKRKIIIKK